MDSAGLVLKSTIEVAEKGGALPSLKSDRL